MRRPEPPSSVESDRALPIADGDPEITKLAEARVRAAGCWEAAHLALHFARLYRFEEGPRGEREKACVAQAMEWRRSAKDARAGRPITALPRPGVARARAASDAASPASKRTA